MALRLRRDVQKASYYVWFLGAEEAKGLRGINVINPVLPYLIERSQKQEPLKVTLQVSHKGIKILQESSKHFIPHSAITSSIQRDDIVACVLLLYNPATKCPIHVHAYRCDSETTAEALHQQLQVLINRPDNQKRFAELESRLGLSQQQQQSITSLSSPSKQKRIPTNGTGIRYESNRFISTLSSDTGISTRESEGSEDHHSISPKSPLPLQKPKGDLFDSLAAELRAKLNGNGPPLLLPPRDYDTVHRSKGNLAAIELRRCQNSMIVGATTQQSPGSGPAPTNTTTTTTTSCSAKQVSSRGSSGIGSDLAPSPERQDDRTSSEEDNWSNEADNSIDALKTVPARHTLVRRYCEDVNDDHHKDNYLRDLPSKTNRPKYANRDLIDREWNREDEIRPKLVRPTNKNWDIENNNNNNNNNRHRKIKTGSGEGRGEITRRGLDEDDEPPSIPRQQQQRIISGYPEDYDIHSQNKKEIPFRNKFQRHRETYDDEYELEKDIIEERKPNLTDRQKYQKSYNQKIEIRGVRKYNERKSPENHREIQPKPMRHHYYPSPDRERPRSADRYRSSIVIDDEPYSYEYDRNPYKEPESLPYRESIEKMLKSPIMRYKSFDDCGFNSKITSDHLIDDGTLNNTKIELPRRSHYRDENYSHEYHHDNLNDRPSYIQSSSSLSSARKHPSHPIITHVDGQQSQDSGLKVSFKERFQEAKEKFRAMEKIKYTTEQQIPLSSSQTFHDLQQYGKEYNNMCENDCNDNSNNWSDEERPLNRIPSRGVSRNLRRSEKRNKDDINLQHHHQPSPIVSSKSLSNLVKGYRHSYAEPRPALPRSSGRVGLAAVNPF